MNHAHKSKPEEAVCLLHGKTLLTFNFTSTISIYYLFVETVSLLSLVKALDCPGTCYAIKLASTHRLLAYC